VAEHQPILTDNWKATSVVPVWY